MKDIKKCLQVVLDDVEIINTIQPTTNLIEDIGMDSLSIIQLVVEIENLYSISIPDDQLDFDQIIIWGNLCNLVDKLTK